MSEVRPKMCDCLNKGCHKTVLMSMEEMLGYHRRGLNVVMKGCALQPGETIVESKGKFWLVREAQYVNPERLSRSSTSSLAQLSAGT